MTRLTGQGRKRGVVQIKNALLPAKPKQKPRRSRRNGDKR